MLHVRLSDDSVVPSHDDIAGFVDSVRDHVGVATIRTAALFPRSAGRFAEAGFGVADTLCLLRADLDSHRVNALAIRERRGRATRIATMRRWNYAAAANVDRAAFGPTWGHDAAELDEIRHATPRHRARFCSPRGRPFSPALCAFAVAGASSEHGYLQRLSVDPTHQRHGHGRALTIDAMRWMARMRLPDCLVNTSVENAAALALYESVGFSPMRDHLSVMQLDLRAAA
jgi:ribosomal-protein-alanine N-acetyltransferase